MSRRLLAFSYTCILAVLISSLCFGAEVRKLGANDLELGVGTTTSPAGKVVTKLNASHLVLPIGDNTLSLDNAIAWVDVRAYIPSTLHAGIAARTDTTDLTAYIQAAFDNVSASTSKRGYIFFPDGLYNYASSLSLSGKRNVTIIGTRFNSGAAPIGAELRFTGTGSGSALDFTHSYGIRVHRMTLSYSNESFTGKLLNLSGTGGVGSQHYMVDQCALYGTGTIDEAGGPINASALIDVDYSWNGTIQENYFLFADVGITGGHTSYTAAIKVKNNLFQLMNTSAIKDSGQAWTISGNTFEPLNNASGGYGEPGAYSHSASPGSVAQAVTFEGNWFGDVATAITGAWLNIAGYGIRIVGNIFGLNSGGTAILVDGNNVLGLEVSGNAASTTTYSTKPSFLKWTTSGHGAWRIGPNFIDGDNTITELNGTLPYGSIWQANNYDNSIGYQPRLLLGTTDISAGISKIIVSEATWNIAFTPDNTAVSTSFAVSGVARGDIVHVAHTAATTPGDVFIGTAIDTDNVAVTYINHTGGDRTPEGTVKIKVWKH